MPAILNWVLRLLPTNPICLRLIQGGSRRVRHLYLRSGYLAVMIVVMLFVLLGEIGGSSMSMRSFAAGGAQLFTVVSLLQVGLICLLTPVFMAGAIAQEASPRTWDILLTTPLNSMQIVLGNLFGRLFFVLALLLASLPLFAVTQYFGGVPGSSIFQSYAIAACSALLVAAIAVTLSVTRTAGKRAVFLFYFCVIIYLFLTYAADIQIRQPVRAGSITELSTVLTPLNPFLALEVLLYSNSYIARPPTDSSSWISNLWFSHPIATFCWICLILSGLMVAYSTLRVRMIGMATGSLPWWRRLVGLSAVGSSTRVPRPVGRNPISWRESHNRGRNLPSILGRWGFVIVGIAIPFLLTVLMATDTVDQKVAKQVITVLVAAEVIVITLVAINMSATAVAREREDGTLDLILTTPIQPGPYIAGKLRGIVQFLAPMMAVPITSMLIVAIFVLSDGFGRGATASIPNPFGGSALVLPLVLPEVVIALILVLVPFTAFCVMVGLQWSIRSKSTISSVVFSVLTAGSVLGLLSLCGIPAGANFSFAGAFIESLSPINVLYTSSYPVQMIPDALNDSVFTARLTLFIGAVVGALIYSLIVWAMYANMKRGFMMTVRRLAGTA